MSKYSKFAFEYQLCIWDKKGREHFEDDNTYDDLDTVKLKGDLASQDMGYVSPWTEQGNKKYYRYWIRYAKNHMIYIRSIRSHGKNS